MPKSLVKAILALTGFILALSLVSPVFADGGAHLWFYSVDPDTIACPPADQPLPDPQVWDNWVGTSTDPWVHESIITAFGTSFSIWLGCKKFESLNTQLVVSINDAAFAAIESITVKGTPIDSWLSGMPSQLSPHGVFNSAEFYGYQLVPLGDLYSPPGTPYKVEIPVVIELKSGADATGVKVHFDAYGYTANPGSLMRNPYSHDFTVPEPATLFMALTALGALGVYAYKRKKTQ